MDYSVMKENVLAVLSNTAKELSESLVNELENQCTTTSNLLDSLYSRNPIMKATIKNILDTVETLKSDSAEDVDAINQYVSDIRAFNNDCMTQDGAYMRIFVNDEYTDNCYIPKNIILAEAHTLHHRLTNEINASREAGLTKLADILKTIDDDVVNSAMILGAIFSSETDAKYPEEVIKENMGNGELYPDILRSMDAPMEDESNRVFDIYYNLCIFITVMNKSLQNRMAAAAEAAEAEEPSEGAPAEDETTEPAVEVSSIEEPVNPIEEAIPMSEI